MLVQSVLNKAAQKKVGQSIIVVIEPHGTRRPAGRGYTRFFGHVRECAITIVVIKNALAVSGNEQVCVAVIIVIASSHTHSECAACDTCLFGHIGERAIVVISIKCISYGLGRFEEITQTIINK